jgi:SAM-dependent methyltransferase
MIVVDGQQPDPLVVQIAAALTPGRALDLACGSGRNALWLANNGWSVEAIDNSPAALAAIPNTSGIHSHLADLEKHEYEIEPNNWDLILMVRYLQRDLWQPAKLGLKPGGVIVVIVLLEDPNKQGRFRARSGELREAFNDFQILHSSEGEGLAKLAARKPY